MTGTRDAAELQAWLALHPEPWVYPRLMLDGGSVSARAFERREEIHRRWVAARDQEMSR